MPLHGEVVAFLQGGSAAAVAARIGVIMLATVVTARLFDRVIEHRFRSASQRMDVGRTSYRVVRRLVDAGIYITGFGIAVYTVPQLRQLSFALFASASVIGIVIGFAAQQAFGNIIAGIFIAVFTPFRVGDRIETQQHYGSVEDITLRQTIIATPSNERVIVPNAKILDDYIINYSITDEKSRYSIQVGIAYHEDIDEARGIMLEEADAHELTDGGESEVIVKDLSDSAVVLELRLWAQDRVDAWQAGQDLRETIKKRFDEEGITIPFPQRTLSYLDEPDDR
ncbi:MAG: mechanosensitive ion channel family protein [Candidatus Nanohaloarchaea archaeon]|nr:mechanosensitive ion channel family protein [Candidatus Nanohaloarchaea archaeon]